MMQFSSRPSPVDQSNSDFYPTALKLYKSINKRPSRINAEEVSQNLESLGSYMDEANSRVRNIKTDNLAKPFLAEESQYLVDVLKVIDVLFRAFNNLSQRSTERFREFLGHFKNLAIEFYRPIKEIATQNAFGYNALIASLQAMTRNLVSHDIVSGGPDATVQQWQRIFDEVPDGRTLPYPGKEV